MVELLLWLFRGTFVVSLLHGFGIEAFVCLTNVHCMAGLALADKNSNKYNIPEKHSSSHPLFLVGSGLGLLVMDRSSLPRSFNHFFVASSSSFSSPSDAFLR